MQDNISIAAEMTGDGRRTEFVRTGLAAGFDAATLAIMHGTAASAAEGVGPQLFQALRDDEWSIVQGLLPDNVLGATGGSPRMMLNAALHRARFPRQHWRSLPPQYGRGDMLRQRWSRWISAGVLANLFAALPGLDLRPERRRDFEALGRHVAEAEARRQS